MMPRRRLFGPLLMGLCLLAASLFAEDPPAILTMDQALAAALDAGYDAKILAGNLEISRRQQFQTEARNSFGLSGRLGYTANAGLFGTYKDKDNMLGVPTPEQLNPSSSGLTEAQQKALASANAALGERAIPLPQTITGSLTAAVPGSGGSAFTSIGLSASQKLQLTGYTDGAPVDTTNSSTAIGVTLSQTVWDGMPGGQPKATIEKSHLVLQVQEIAAKTNRLALALRIRQAFLAMVIAQKNLDVLGNINARQTSLLKQAQIKYDLQQATKLDLFDAQISARNAKLDLQNGQNTLVSTREALAGLMGLPPKTEFLVAEPPPRPLPANTLEEAIGKALAQRSDLLQLSLNIESARIDQALALAAANPVVTVNGGVNLALNWTSNGKEDQRQTGTFFAGLNLSMPIIDGGQAASQAALASQQLAIYQQQQTQLGRTISMQIETAWNNCRILQGRVETAGQSVEKLSLQYQLVKHQQSIGTATIKDDLNAAANLASAELAQLQAVFNLQSAVLNLENSMGQ